MKPLLTPDGIMTVTFIGLMAWFWITVIRYWSQEVEPPDGPGGHKHSAEEEWKEAA